MRKFSLQAAPSSKGFRPLLTTHSSKNREMWHEEAADSSKRVLSRPKTKTMPLGQTELPRCLFRKFPLLIQRWRRFNKTRFKNTRTPAQPNWALLKNHLLLPSAGWSTKCARTGESKARASMATAACSPTETMNSPKLLQIKPLLTLQNLKSQTRPLKTKKSRNSRHLRKFRPTPQHFLRESPILPRTPLPSNLRSKIWTIPSNLADSQMIS